MSNLHPRKRRLVIEKEEADVTSSREANVNQGAKKKNKANATALECNTTESPTAGVKMKNNPILGESVSEKHPVRPSLCIAVGTYEHTLRSWKMIPQCNNSPARNVSFDPTLVPFFTDTKHSGSIQCIASNHKWLITGGRDEVLYIYNLKKCSCVGDLALDGEATQVLLTTNHHLLCSTTSGRVHVWKVSSWDIVAAIELHSRACNGIALHPSQKLGLSVGNDRCVSLVNFVKGIKALEIKHKQPLTGVSMAPTTGESYTLIKHRSVDIVSTALGTTQHTLPIEANVVQYISDDLIITGSQDGNITLWDVTNATIVTQQQLGEVDYFPHKQEHKHTEELETSKSATFTVRCRDLSVIRDTLDNELVYITAITSCGVVSVWSLSTRDFHSGKQTVDGDPVLFRLVAKGSRYSSRFMCVASAWIG